MGVPTPPPRLSSVRVWLWRTPFVWVQAGLESSGVGVEESAALELRSIHCSGAAAPAGLHWLACSVCAARPVSKCTYHPANRRAYVQFKDSLGAKVTDFTRLCSRASTAFVLLHLFRHDCGCPTTCFTPSRARERVAGASPQRARAPQGATRSRSSSSRSTKTDPRSSAAGSRGASPTPSAPTGSSDRSD